MTGLRTRAMPAPADELLRAAARIEAEVTVVRRTAAGIVPEMAEKLRIVALAEDLRRLQGALVATREMIRTELATVRRRADARMAYGALAHLAPPTGGNSAKTRSAQ